MRRILGMLSGLTVMVALSAALADEPPQFTLKQHELAAEVLDELGEFAWDVLGQCLNFEEVAHDTPLDIDAVFEGGGWLRQLKIELLFARKACGLSDQEMQSLSRSSELAMKEVVRQLLIQERESETNQGPRLDESQLPRQAPDVVSQVAECQLTPSQWAAFVAERQARTAQRKRVAILNLVTRLDADLRLSPGQRKQLSQLFETHWNEAWGHSLQSLTNEEKFMPPLPHNEVIAILSKTQWLAWSEREYDAENDSWQNDPLGLFADLGEAGLADDEDTESGEETEITDRQLSDD